MGPRLKLIHLAATVAATLCLACPALAQSGTDEAYGAAVVLPTYDYAVPGATQSFSAKDDAAPGEGKVPTPAPSGCPFRDGKLELIV